MNNAIFIISALLVLWTFIYIVSYGAWTWKNHNSLGAIALFIVGLALLALPGYMTLKALIK